MKMFKIVKIVSAIALVVCVFVSVDLGVNLLGALVPEMQDGIPYNSVLQSCFGVLEGTLDTREDFFNAFETSAWITFVVFLENACIYIVGIKNRK